jgi:hypothetical protein
MATTTNYGWTTPDDTALVKDGAAAIRTLGSSVDTTTKALNPSTTLGDIEYRSSTANTNTRLGIGSTNQVLTVSGGVPAWVTPTAESMTLLSTTSMNTGTSTVTVSGISGSYKSLEIQILNPTWASGTAQLWLSIESSSSLQGSGGVMWNSGANTAVAATSGAQMNFSATGNSNTDAKITGLLTIHNYASSTAYKPWSFISGDDTRGSFQGGVVATNTTVDQISIANQFSYNFNGGTILVYGIK